MTTFQHLKATYVRFDRFLGRLIQDAIERDYLDARYEVPGRGSEVDRLGCVRTVGPL